MMLPGAKSLQIHLVLLLFIALSQVASASIFGKKVKHLDEGTGGDPIGEIRLSGLFVRSTTIQVSTKLVTTYWDEEGRPHVVDEDIETSLESAKIYRPHFATITREITKPLTRPARILAFYFGVHDSTAGLTGLAFGDSRHRRLGKPGGKHFTQPTGVIANSTGIATVADSGRNFGNGIRLLGLRKIFGNGAERVDELAQSDELALKSVTLDEGNISLSEPDLGHPNTGKTTKRGSGFPRLFGGIFRRH